jgi:hypothetical protein
VLDTHQADMENTQLLDALRGLTRFLYIRVTDDLEFVKVILGFLPKFIDRIWVLNPTFGKLCLAKDYVISHGYEKAAISADVSKFGFGYFEAFQEILSHDPRVMENFYIILDSEVWLSDPICQRWVLDFSDQLELNPHMVKVFMFVSLTNSPVPDKLTRLFEFIDIEALNDPYVYASEMFDSLAWKDRPSEEQCNDIFKGMTKYQVCNSIVRAFLHLRDLAKGDRPNASESSNLVLRAVTHLLSFKA